MGSKTVSILFMFCAALAPALARAGNAIDVGTGWADMGDTPDVLEWRLSLQGSRKDVPAYAGWRRVGTERLYWSPLARFDYMNFWSIAGGGNALGVTLAPLGLGVYLSRPMSSLTERERVGRWFATFEVNLGFQFGANATPNAPANSTVPDPDAHRAALRAEVAASGHVTSDLLKLPQHYPFGPYAYAGLTLPLRVSAWNMVTARFGVGLFFDVVPAELEWPLSPTMPGPAIGYAITAGLSMLIF
jgi:hypothetical protein